jgi:cell division protease FtsH
VKGREAILRVHLRGKPLEVDVDIESLARATAGFSGADLANLVNEGAILAARRNRSRVAMTDLDESIDRVMLGPERRSRVMSADERRLTAYHEAGHVVVGHFMEHHDRPQKVSIVARGAAGGYTKFLPEEETRYRTGTMLRDRMCAALGGYVAEEMVFGEPSTGAANDLDEVTEIARRMVMRWGMSTDLGARTFGRGDEYVWLRENEGPRGYSDEAAIAIDREVRQLTDEARARARVILKEHRHLLDKLVEELLDHETLQGDDLERLLRNDGERNPPREANARSDGGAIDGATVGAPAITEGSQTFL